MIITFERKCDMTPWQDFYPGFIEYMTERGWTYDSSWNDHEYYRFRKSVVAMFESNVQAIVFSAKEHLQNSGEYGVAWLECVGYDCNYDKYGGPSIRDLNDMLDALIIAEDDLVRSGMPFVPDYIFHGRNTDSLRVININLRRELNLKRWEKEGFAALKSS